MNVCKSVEVSELDLTNFLQCCRKGAIDYHQQSLSKPFISFEMGLSVLRFYSTYSSLFQQILIVSRFI